MYTLAAERVLRELTDNVRIRKVAARSNASFSFQLGPSCIDHIFLFLRHYWGF